MFRLRRKSVTWGSHSPFVPNQVSRCRRVSSDTGRRLLLLAFAAWVQSCHAEPGLAPGSRVGSPALAANVGALPMPEPQPSPRPVDAVVVVAVDGVRWQDVFHGVDAELLPKESRPTAMAPSVPNLMRWFRDDGVLIGDAARGDDVEASGPEYVSLPGYEEILSGRPPTCRDNRCLEAGQPTLFDELRGHSAVLVSSWELIPRVAAHGPLVASAGRGAAHPSLAEGALGRLAAEGSRAAPWPGGDGYRPDAHTASLALETFDVIRPRFLFVGLGDTDEHAHHGDYLGYLSALRVADAFIGALVAKASQREAQGERIAIFVTTDHGRAANFRDHGGAYPESRRVWLGARGAALLSAGPRTARLSDLAKSARAALGL